MTNTLDLNKLSLEPMSEDEMVNSNGGFPIWPIVVGAAVVAIVNNFGEFLNGIGDAMNGKNNPPKVR